MKMSQGIGHEPSLQRLVIASVVLHFILMALFFIPFKTGEKEFKNYYVSLVEPAKVSGGGEVAVRKAEEKPTSKKEAPSKEKKIDDKNASAKKKDVEGENKEKSIEGALNNIRRDRQINEAVGGVLKAKGDKEKEQKINIVRNEIQGASEKGAGGKGAPMASDSYYAEIIRKIEDEYVVPPNFDSAGLDVILMSINIDSKGNVVGSPTIEKSSGNDLFDQSARKAILKASPLPPPPPLLEMPIGLRFKP